MRVTTSLLACAGLASANSFQDTSPFIFFSTSEVLASPPQIASAPSLTKTLTSALSQCLTDVYFLVRAPGVSASDFHPPSNPAHGQLRGPNYLAAKYLSADAHAIRSSFSVAQVVGPLSTPSLAATLVDACGASTVSLDASTGVVVGSTDAANVTNPRIVHVEFPALEGAERDPARWQMERTHEMQLETLIQAHGGKSYTVLFTTSPASAGDAEEEDGRADAEVEYEMDNSQVPVNMELKRDLAGRKDGKKADGKPLFEKYQFFTPALFQGLGVFLLLGSILYIAISAIGGMTVSYAAFDKENGPQAGRKQQ